MIKAVIFDHGGVFGKDVMSSIYSETAIRAHVSVNAARSEVHKIRSMIQKGKITMDEFWKVYAQRLNSDPSIIKVVWTKMLENTAKIDKKVENIVKKLKKEGYKVALCTNTIKAFSEFHKRNNDYGIFDFVIISCDIGMQKPDREMYEFVLKKLNVKPDECVFIDNQMENVKGAMNAGMKAILFENAEQLKEELKKCGVHGI